MIIAGPIFVLLQVWFLLIKGVQDYSQGDKKRGLIKISFFFFFMVIAIMGMFFEGIERNYLIQYVVAWGYAPVMSLYIPFYLIGFILKLLNLEQLQPILTMVFSIYQLLIIPIAIYFLYRFRKTSKRETIVNIQ